MDKKQKKKYAPLITAMLVLALAAAIIIIWLALSLPLLLKIVTSVVSTIIIAFTIYALQSSIKDK